MSLDPRLMMAKGSENVSKTGMSLQLDLAFVPWEARADLMIHEYKGPHSSRRRVTTPWSRGFLLTYTA